MPVVLIDNYDSFTYNLYQYVQELVSEPLTVYRNDAVTLADLQALGPSHIILSPGPGHPGIAGDFGVCADVLTNHETLGCPVLGVCLGHQGMVHYAGGRVVQAPEIVHGKTSMIRILTDSPLFDGLSNPFTAMRYHSLVADETDFPASLEITAREDRQGLVMALQHRERPLYGIQFHPESIGTPEGKHLLKNFVTQC